MSQGAGLFRRLAALVYDILPVSAVALLVTGLALALARALQLSGMISVHNDVELTAMLSNSIAFQVLLWFSILYFYTWFWTHGGQTIGMRVWRLRVQNTDASPISMTQACIRLATAAFGLGNLAVPFDPQKRAFQDIWAKCEVVVTEKAAKKV